MKNIFKLSFFLAVLTTVATSCKKDDTEDVIISTRDRAEVYAEDIAEIKAYLQENHLIVSPDLETTVRKVEGSDLSMWDEYKSAAFGDEVPYLEIYNDIRTSYNVSGQYTDTVKYKLYYILLREGGGETPSRVDSTFVGYKGWNLDNNVFDENNQGIWFSYPAIYQGEGEAISGFRHILAKLKTATGVTEDPETGTVTHENYGTALVFIPSGLAYFSGANTGTSYSPLAFQVKLFKKKQTDHDRDRVKGAYEDTNNNGDFFDDDTDGDDIPDFLDVDDDGDGVTTKTEIRKPTGETGFLKYYPFNPIMDDPNTPDIDETDTKGIPNCAGDYVTIPRLRKHLDRNCQ